MSKNKFLIYIVALIFIFSCAKKPEVKNEIIEKNLESQFIKAYQEGEEALNDGDVLFAAKKFNEAETLFPQSKLAPRAALMAAYSYYTQDYYGDAIAELERFIRIYKVDTNLDYANYLLSICYYEQIVDEKKDLNSINKAKNSFENLIQLYPNTEYAIDAEFKLDLINDILAAKEMYVGRYYFDKKKWIPAINRFRVVVDKYETTIYIEEALHRLVEVYYLLGLKSEASKYAKILGYNYQSSQWYEKTYSVFNEMYNKDKKLRKNQNKSNLVLKKFKSLFE